MGGYVDENAECVFGVYGTYSVLAQEKDAEVIKKDEGRKSCYAQHSGIALAEENLHAGKEW